MILLAGSLLLSACAAMPSQDKTNGAWQVRDGDSTTVYLHSLRDYMAQPAGDREAYRERLHEAAEEGDSKARLQHALALSVDREDRSSLEQARDYFETLLAAPEPMPVALDALVRLQLGEVLDRLERMQASGEIHHAYRAAATERKVCTTELGQRHDELAQTRAELQDVKRKLDALARIEQTVNEQLQESGDEDNDGRNP